MGKDRAKAISVLRPGQGQLLDDLTTMLGIQLGKGVDFPLEEAFIPGESELQRSAFDRALAGPGEGARDTLAKIESGTPSALISPDNINAILDKFLEGFDTRVAEPERLRHEDTVRELRRRFGESGAGGSVGEAIGRETSRFSTELASQRSNTLLEGLRAALGQSETAADRALGFQGLRQNDITLQAGLGGEQRGITSQLLGEPLARSLFEAPFNNPWLTQFLGPSLSPSNAAVVLPDRTAETVSAISGGIGALGGLVAAFCYAAAEYFGWGTPDWYAARRWIALRAGDRFRDLYFERSRDLADAISESPALKDRLRGFFEQVATAGWEMLNE